MPAENHIEVTVGDYGTILVEIAPTAREGWREAGRPVELVQKMTVEFERVMETVRAIARGFRDGLERLEEKTRPDEATLEFGLKLGGETDVVLVRASGEAAFKISLTWKSGT